MGEKSKLEQNRNFCLNAFDNLSFSIHSVTPLQIRSTPLVTPYLWPHLRKIKFFIIDSFCLYYVIHPFSTDMMVQFMCCVPCKSLLILGFSLFLQPYLLLHLHTGKRDQNCLPANIQSVLGYSDKPFYISAVKNY